MLEQLLKGQNPAAMLSGERLAALMMSAQFAAQCELKVLSYLEANLQDKLTEIHKAGGLVVSVDFNGWHIVAYMPKEQPKEKSDGNSIQH